MSEPMVISEITMAAAREWFTIAPKLRTIAKLAEHIQAAIDEAGRKG